MRRAFFSSKPEAARAATGGMTVVMLKRGMYLLRTPDGRLIDSNGSEVTLNTCGVLGGAYRGRDIDDRSMLTHTEVPGTNDALCGRVKSGHLADAEGDPEGAQEPPTCEACLARDPRFNGAGVAQRSTRRRHPADDPVPFKRLDAATRAHLDRWLEHARGSVGDPDRLEAERRIARAMDDDPSLVERSSWPEIEQMGRRLEPNSGDGAEVFDRSNSFNVVEYAVREMFKRKSIQTAARNTVKNLSGHHNMFLGPGITVIDQKKLEAAIWDRMTEAAINNVKRFKPGAGRMAVLATLDHFMQPEKLEPELRRRVTDSLGYDPYVALEPNSPRYYVWVVDGDGDPIEWPYGPHDLESAKTYARIAATEGKHDRAVSRGRDPNVSSFEIVRQYAAGTGERVI